MSTATTIASNSALAAWTAAAVSGRDHPDCHAAAEQAAYAAVWETVAEVAGNDPSVIGFVDGVCAECGRGNCDGCHIRRSARSYAREAADAAACAQVTA